MLQPTRRWEWLGGLQRKDFEASLPKNGVSLTLVENTASAAAIIRWFPSPPSPLSFPLFSPPPSFPLRCSGLRRNPSLAGAPTHATAAREGRERESGGWRGYRSSLEGPGGWGGEADHVAPPPGVAGLAGLGC